MRLPNEASVIVILVAMSAFVHAADKEPPKPDERRGPASARTQMGMREQSPEWMLAMERLRLQPKAGEIRNAGVTATLGEVYDLSADEKANFTHLQEEYDAALLKKAAAWEEDEKALRDEYEQKIVQALPESKRENTKKLLALSHAQWASGIDRESILKKAIYERARAQQKAQQTASADEVREGRAQMMAWIKEQRSKSGEQDEQNLNAMKALLSPDEAAKLEQFNRNRVVAPATASSPK